LLRGCDFRSHPNVPVYPLPNALTRLKIIYVTAEIVGSVSWVTEVTWPEPFKSILENLDWITPAMRPFPCVAGNFDFFDVLIGVTAGML